MEINDDFINLVLNDSPYCYREFSDYIYKNLLQNTVIIYENKNLKLIEFYLWYGNKWKKTDKQYFLSILMDFLSKISYVYEHTKYKFHNTIINRGGNNAYKHIDKNLLRFTKKPFLYRVIECLMYSRGYLRDNHSYDDNYYYNQENLTIKYNEYNQNTIGFSNGFYDIRDFSFKKFTTNDFITNSLDYPLLKPSDDKINECYEFLDNLFENREQTDAFMYILTRSLSTHLYGFLLITDTNDCKRHIIKKLTKYCFQDYITFASSKPFLIKYSKKEMKNSLIDAIDSKILWASYTDEKKKLDFYNVKQISYDDCHYYLNDFDNYKVVFSMIIDTNTDDLFNLSPNSSQYNAMFARLTNIRIGNAMEDIDDTILSEMSKILMFIVVDKYRSFEDKTMKYLHNNIMENNKEICMKNIFKR